MAARCSAAPRRERTDGMRLAVTIVVLAVAAPAGAQVPRTADGRLDLSGIWQVLNTAVWDIQDHSASLGVPAGQGVVEGGEIPYRPEAVQQRQQNHQNRL